MVDFADIPNTHLCSQYVTEPSQALFSEWYMLAAFHRILFN